MYHKGGKAFKNTGSCVAVAIIALKNFVLLLKSFIANALKYKTHLKLKFKCIFIIICPLLMSLFSCDFIYNRLI